MKAANGVGEDYYKADELVATITTDDNGIAKVENLPVGKYYVKEVKTVHGYVLDEEPKEVDLSYRDQDTPVVTFDEDWNNNRQKVAIRVIKKEKNTDNVLEGCVFALYSREDIKSASGKVLLKKDEIIEQKATDTKGEIHFTADLPVDGKYYVKEIKAPEGFVTSGEEQDFTFEYAGEKEAEVTYEFVFENDVTKIEISKQDMTTGKELPGAKLTIFDEAGNEVESWTSEEKAHYIEKLPVGKYTLHEESAPEGYLVSEDVSFEVKDTGEIQKVVMKDEVKPVETETPKPDTGTETPKQDTTTVTNAPKTGDNSKVGIWLLMMAVALCGVGTSVFYLRKKRK
ncbi:MAG: SpaA isopeptide-forming pilin-related protein [Anaerostipes sp.]|nr:SpaA isopeptide-forming pilin-related protein [Anaerostipes sp.]